MATIQFLSAMLTVMIGLSQASCDQTGDRVVQSLEGRAKASQYTVYGTIISDQMPTAGNNSTKKEYKVVVEPLCWLKRGSESGSISDRTTDEDGGRGSGSNKTSNADHKNSTQEGTGLNNITVAEHTYPGDCIHNDLIKGKKYILFLQKQTGQDQYSVENLDEQSGVITPTDMAFKDLYRGIDASVDGRPMAHCKEGEEIPCFVENRDACNKGVVQSVALLTLTVLVVVALAFCN